MKKLSILLALIMALSCFTFAASALVSPDEMTPEESATYEEMSKKAAEEASKAAEEASKAKVQESIAASEAADRAKAEKEASSVKAELSKKEEEESKAKEKLIYVAIKVVYSAAHPDGSYHDSSAGQDPENWTRDSHNNWVNYRIVHAGFPVGTVVTASTITSIVASSTKNDEMLNGAPFANDKVKTAGSKPTMVIDGTEYILNDNVFRGIPKGYYSYDASTDTYSAHINDVVIDTINHPEWNTSLGTVTLKREEDPYGFICYAAEIDDVENFALVAASQLGGFQWNGVAKANVALVNEIIKGFNSAADVVAEELPAAVASNKAAENGKAVNGTTATSTSPKTGTSAVAGVAIVVLALATTTTVVLRKKED